MFKGFSRGRVLASVLGIGLLFAPSIQSSGEDVITPGGQYLNITPPREGEVIGDWASGQVVNQLNSRIGLWAAPGYAPAEDVFGTMYQGLDGLARGLAADATKQTIANAKDGLLSDQGTSYTLDKIRPLDLTLNGLAQTSEAMLDHISIAAFANMEVRAGVGSDQKPSFSILTVQPLYEDEDSRHNVFAQGGLGYRFDNFKNRTTLNLGFGYRYLTPDEKWLYGTSIFYDHEFPYDHQRLGLGAEIESSLYRMGTNYYRGLSKWKDTRTDYQEKPLDGMDLEIAGRLAAFPELEMAVRGTVWDRLKGEKNIHELAVRGEYTPVPAISMRVEVRDDNISKPSVEATIGFKFDFGKSLADQFKPETREALLSVKARRFHVVERQNTIRVQEYSVAVDLSMVPPMTTINAAGQSFDKGCNTNNVDANCQADEQPEHAITFASSFEIGTYEVTWDDYQKCVDDGGCATAPVDDGYGQGTRPVTKVSWNDITNEYLPWLNGKTGRTYRLPTESEWEYVARAGTTTAYPAGAALVANTANCSAAGCGDAFINTSPVGSFAANAFGVYDTIGNVWEWTQDLYQNPYPGASPTDGTAYTAAGVNRVTRGGSWLGSAFGVRSANRSLNVPTGRSRAIGFRLARTI